MGKYRDVESKYRELEKQIAAGDEDPDLVRRYIEEIKDADKISEAIQAAVVAVLTNETEFYNHRGSISYSDLIRDYGENPDLALFLLQERLPIRFANVEEFLKLPIEQRTLLRAIELTHFKDADLTHLSGLTKLKKLDYLYSRQLTGEGLAHLSDLTELRELNLRGCEQLTNEGLRHLTNLTGLKKLYLPWCSQLTNEGVAHLSALTKLKILDLRGFEQLTDEGLAHLSALTELKELNLWRCRQLTDKGLTHLAGLTKLTELDLGDCTQLTNDGLTHLKGLTELRKLDLIGCKLLTDEGLADLKEKLPNCEIITKQPTVERPTRHYGPPPQAPPAPPAPPAP